MTPRRRCPPCQPRRGLATPWPSAARRDAIGSARVAGSLGERCLCESGSESLLSETLGFRNVGDHEWEARGDKRGGRFSYDPAPAQRGLSGAGTVHLIVDVNGMSDIGIQSFPNRRSTGPNPHSPGFRRPHV